MRRLFVITVLLSVSLCGCATRRTVQVDIQARDIAAGQPAVDVVVRMTSQL